MNILRANRWKLPDVIFHKHKKSANCWKAWFAFDRYWGGKLWYFTVRRFTLVLDFRMCPWSDMAFPWASKRDREAVKEANKYL